MRLYQVLVNVHNAYLDTTRPTVDNRIVMNVQKTHMVTNLDCLSVLLVRLA